MDLDRFGDIKHSTCRSDAKGDKTEAGFKSSLIDGVAAKRADVNIRPPDIGEQECIVCRFCQLFPSSSPEQKQHQPEHAGYPVRHCSGSTACMPAAEKSAAEKYAAYRTRHTDITAIETKTDITAIETKALDKFKCFFMLGSL